MWVVSLAALVLALSYAPAIARDAAAELSSEELSKLERGELVVRATSERRGDLRLIGGTSFQVVSAPPEVVWQALLDTQYYRRMLPELQSAQRKAAWADVARRIAHEIKNPLTPIQLSAERLKRRFAKEIQSDPETFALCADTIIRHVGDIGRMVDEFSAFARMPQPVIKPEDLGQIAPQPGCT